MSDIFIDGVEVGLGLRPYIIAEACNNFNGDIKIAKEMVIAANEAGADAIKFQMRLQPERITPEEHMELQEYCADTGITYLCTAFDEHGLDILEYMKVPAIKIGSAECINEAFLKSAKQVDVPLIISTGGTGPDDVDMIAKYADIMLHTMSIYPTPINRCYIDTISAYGLHYFGLPIGFSDHSPSIYPSIGAVAVGACMIEKHFILDKRMDAVDAPVSIDPAELKELVRACDEVYDARGISIEYLMEERFKLERFRGRSH